MLCSQLCFLLNFSKFSQTERNHLRTEHHWFWTKKDADRYKPVTFPGCKIHICILVQIVWIWTFEFYAQSEVQTVASVSLGLTVQKGFLRWAEYGEKNLSTSVSPGYLWTWEEYYLSAVAANQRNLRTTYYRPTDPALECTAVSQHPTACIYKLMMPQPQLKGRASETSCEGHVLPLGLMLGV